MTGSQNETELVLRLTRDELFDAHILLPHEEVNAAVYQAVNQFVEKYSGDTMQLTIMSDHVLPITQEIFAEAYRFHYEDEYQKVTRYLRRRNVRGACLLLVSVLSFWLSSFLSHMGGAPEFLINIFGQASIFCLWEIGYTSFTRSDAAAERDRIVRARDAEIRFHSRS